MDVRRAQNLSPDAICAALAGLQLGGTDPFVDGESQGGECHIFKASFKDSPSLSVRINHPVHEDQQDTINNVSMETRIFRTLEENGFPWSPRYRAASLTFDNPINYPFMVLDWAEGFPLKWDDDYPSRPIRDILLAQLTTIQLSLVTYTWLTGDFLGSTTATEFFERRISNYLNGVRGGKLPGLTEKDCLDQLALLPKVLGNDARSTLFAIDHGDLKPTNIIVDEENNIRWQGRAYP
ncbi:hypothetical protein NLG97_g1382 [Lecanicillium saksenae]|uniref:Uncharacterized protein n=1 Tax=Lecanicillium saksenae TaxID=468837 RepID=A0ACC1R575_9HYPO|nr:hypothetical protein NLG97_g1382 [Lecanicillium saksenae]